MRAIKPTITVDQVVIFASVFSLTPEVAMFIVDIADNIGCDGYKTVIHQVDTNQHRWKR